MKRIPDQYFDIIITDPPYGLGAKNIIVNPTRTSYTGFNSRPRSKPLFSTDFEDDGKWDESIPSKEIFDEMFRVSKKQIIFGGNFMTEYLKPNSCWVVWDKDNGGCPFADCELAWTSFSGAIRRFKWKWNGLLQQDMYNKDDVWMKVAKHTKLKETDTSKVAAIVVKEDYPIVESIEEKGLSVKKAITNGKTPTQQIRNVSKYISLSDRVDSLERKVSEMEHKYDIEFSKVKEQQMIQENRLESIERDLTDYMNPKKISAIRMRMEGKLNVEIAEILDVVNLKVKDNDKKISAFS
jgi:hypothetical protein